MPALFVRTDRAPIDENGQPRSSDRDRVRTHPPGPMRRWTRAISPEAVAVEVEPVRFVTRERAKVDRGACCWQIRHFADRKAEFLFVPRERVRELAQRESAVPFDAPGTELLRYKENGEERVSFDARNRKFGVTDPAPLGPTEIVRGANASLTPPRLESAGLEAWAMGFRSMARSDPENPSLSFVAYDTLQACYRQNVAGSTVREPTEPKGA